MKCGGYWHFLILVLLILFLTCPAYANMIIKPTVSRFFFEKDGMPYNQSVTFTVTCYHFLPTAVQIDQPSGPTDGNTLREKTLSFSGTCLYYGCPVEDLTNYVKFNTNACDLEGRTMGQPFVFRNFSNIPAMYCIDPLYQYDVRKRDLSNYTYYKFTPEYQDCMKRIQPLKDQCRQYTYAYTCGLNTSRECGGYTIVGDEDVNYDDADAYIQCIAPFDKEKETCEHYLSPVDPSSMMFTKYNYTPSRYCESRFTIPSYIETPAETPNLTRQKQYPSLTPYITQTVTPSQSHTPEITPSSTVPLYTPTSPVASLYCSIVQFLGGRCE